MATKSATRRLHSLTGGKRKKSRTKSAKRRIRKIPKSKRKRK